MMLTAVKGAFARKGRLALTFVSIMLGVAFVAGTFVFTDTIQARFDTLFTDVYAGVDATVRAPVPEFGGGETVEAATIGRSLVDTARSVDGVAAAEGYVRAFGQVIDTEGNPVGGMGAPTYVYSWITDPNLNPLRITDGNGRAPSASGEFVVDAATAESAGLELGDLVDIQFASGASTFTLVGIASFGDATNLAGATIATVGLEDAQRILGLDDQVTYIDVAGAEGVDQDTLVERLAATLPADVEVVSGSQQTAEAISGFTEGLAFVSIALLAFAAIAVFVGAFIIYNTFRIIVAQRTRELALMRALGASSRQVIAVVLGEAFVVALLASLAGIVAGVGVAQLLKAGMGAVGFGPPDGPLTLEPRTIVVSLAVGLLVTMASALMPAIRAARIAPVTAMAATAPSREERRVHILARAAVLVAGVVAVAAGLAADLPVVLGAGALSLVLGTLLLAPVLTRPTAMVIGRVFPGISGQLARENTVRDPRRTSATAAALTVGIAMVVFTAIFAASSKASITATLEDSFRSDVSVQSSNLYMPVSPAALQAVRGVTDVAVASPVAMGVARVNGIETTVTSVDASTIDRVYDAGVAGGLGTLTGGLAVDESLLEEWQLVVGDPVAVQTPSGESVNLPIAGTLSNTTLGSIVVDQSTWAGLGGGADATSVLIGLREGVDANSGRHAIEEALTAFPALTVTTTSDQIANAITQVDAVLVLFTGLLGLALLIAVLGIANTLALSIVERTREIGLLRAVGMSRAQVRWMITDESTLTALFGALVGGVLGLALGRVLVAAFADQGLSSFAVPVGQLAVWIALAAVAGVVAAALPARKAARLDVLRAIAYD